VKVRIGLGLGTRTNVGSGVFETIVDRLEHHHADSLWLSERINGPAPDPLIALALAAGRTNQLKLGTSVLVIPGRNPVVLAKSLATLAQLSGGRLLPALGLGAVDPIEQQAFGVERAERGRIFDEMIEVMRACWTGEPVAYEGQYFQVSGVRVRPVPPRLDVWLGGISPAELRRVGRHGDGWLPSFITPSDAERGRLAIETECAERGRIIEDDHYGVLIPYRSTGAPIPEHLLATLSKRRPDLDDPSVLVPDLEEGLGRLIEEFVAVGTTKFVVLPIDEPGTPDSWTDHIDRLATTVFPLERETT
jgi:probable F420-dependent oxidoreductase